MGDTVSAAFIMLSFMFPAIDDLSSQAAMVL